MNKGQLVDALAARLGDRRTAAAAVDGLLDVIVRTVHAGESVSLTGFGVFERRARAARVARNPRTGETVQVPAASVPAFRPGAGFRDAVSGARPLGAPAATASRAAAAAPSTPTAAPRAAAKPGTTRATEPFTPAPASKKVPAKTPSKGKAAAAPKPTAKAADTKAADTKAADKSKAAKAKVAPTAKKSAKSDAKSGGKAKKKAKK